MRVVPTHGTLHGGTHDNPVSCPPEPFLEVDEAEYARLTALGAVRDYVDGEVATTAAVFEITNADATPEGVEVEQASVGAEGAASGEAAPAESSEATSESEAEEQEVDGETANQDLLDNIELLTEDDFVKTGPRAGKPKVAPLAAAIGKADLTAEEVDAAFAVFEASKGVGE